MQHAYRGQRPTVADGVFIASGAHVIGRVTLKAESSVWFNVVVRGDTDTIAIDRGTNIQDGTVVHTDPGYPVRIGQNVTVGHSCIIHGCEIGDDCLIGMGTTILTGAKVGDHCLVAAGSLILGSAAFPPGSVIMGRPAQVVRPVGDKELGMIRRGGEHYRDQARVYGQEFV